MLLCAAAVGFDRAHDLLALLNPDDGPRLPEHVGDATSWDALTGRFEAFGGCGRHHPKRGRGYERRDEARASFHVRAFTARPANRLPRCGIVSSSRASTRSATA